MKKIQQIYALEIYFSIEGRIFGVGIASDKPKARKSCISDLCLRQLHMSCFPIESLKFVGSGFGMYYDPGSYITGGDA